MGKAYAPDELATRDLRGQHRRHRGLHRRGVHLHPVGGSDMWHPDRALSGVPQLSSYAGDIDASDHPDRLDRRRLVRGRRGRVLLPDLPLPPRDGVTRASTSPARRSTRSAGSRSRTRSCSCATSSSSSARCASGTTSSRTCRPRTRRCGSSRSSGRGASSSRVPTVSSTPPTTSRPSTSCTSRSARPITIELESRDVLHDFSVPVFRLKQDAIPGRVITGWWQGHRDRRVRHPVRGDLRHRTRA